MEKNYFTQLCVWQGVVLDGFTTQEFVDWMLENFNARIKFINDQEKEIKKEINELVNSDQTVKKQI
jgi:hypothetical protein